MDPIKILLDIMKDSPDNAAVRKYDVQEWVKRMAAPAPAPAPAVPPAPPQA